MTKKRPPAKAPLTEAELIERIEALSKLLPSTHTGLVVLMCRTDDALLGLMQEFHRRFSEKVAGALKTKHEDLRSDPPVSGSPKHLPVRTRGKP